MGLIQIRDVPDEVHRTVKVRAAAAGVSLSTYLLREVEALAGRPTNDELADRIKARGPSGVTTQEILDAVHDGRR